MSYDFNTLYKEDSPGFLGSVLRGILGSVTGMLVCILAMLLCWLCHTESFCTTLLLFVPLVIGWFYRLFHGRRSKTAAYVTVGICTILACALWGVLLALLPFVVSGTQLTADDWHRLWNMIWKLLLLCVGVGYMVFLFTRRNLLIYADWKRGPWHTAYTGGNGASYNLLPEKLPNKIPQACFAVHSRFSLGTGIIVEGNSFRWKHWIRKDHVCTVHDIAGVVLGPSNGCNVIYDKNYQILAKFAGSMEHADLLLSWLLYWNIPIDQAPDGWQPPVEDSSDPIPAESFVSQRQFTLRLKRSARIGFTGIGWLLLLLGLALFPLFDFSALTIIERWVFVILELALMVMGIVYLHIGKVCRVEIDGEQIRVASRFGRSATFSVREVSAVSRSIGWIVLYDREFKTLAKLDSYLENLNRLKEYLEFYGVKM